MSQYPLDYDPMYEDPWGPWPDRLYPCPAPRKESVWRDVLRRLRDVLFFIVASATFPLLAQLLWLIPLGALWIIYLIVSTLWCLCLAY